MKKLEKRWVCPEGTEKKNNLLIQFRREFESFEGGALHVRIHACREYALYLNGRFIKRGPAPSCYRFPYYDEITVSTGEGRFCIAAEVYCEGENIPCATGQNMGPAALNICVEAGEKKFCGEDFRCRLAPHFIRGDTDADPMANRISAWGGFKEIYDTRLCDGWKYTGYDDRGWEYAHICVLANTKFGEPERYNIPSPKTIERIVPEVLETIGNLGRAEVFSGGAAALHTQTPGSFPAVIYDFTREITGYPEAVVKGERGSSISFWYGESLDLLRTDTFILNGEEQTLSPFCRRAFRYLKISANGGGTVYISRVTAGLVHFPLAERVKTEFSDPLFQKVYDVSLYTARLASQYHFEDSVYRERAQWLLDSRITALVHYECFGEYRLGEKAIRQFCRTQTEEGVILPLGPMPAGRVMPDFCTHFVMMAEEHFRYSGKGCDGEIMSALSRLFAWFEKNEAADGLIDISGKEEEWWCFIDWADTDRRGKVTALNCLYFQALCRYADILERAGKEGGFYRAKAERLKENINRIMYDSASGLYCDCVADGIRSRSFSQQASMYAVITGVAEEPEKVLYNVTSEGFSGVKVRGAFLMCLCLDCMLENGYKALAREWTDKFWGEMLRRGATTWWEVFEPDSPPAAVPYAYSANTATYMMEYIPVSYCHAWGAGIAYSLKRARERGVLN